MIRAHERLHLLSIKMSLFDFFVIFVSIMITSSLLRNQKREIFI